MEDFPSEVNSENLEEFLVNDSTFVDYFNTFLSLPCFPERIFYNKGLDLLEQFSQKLVKDESDNVQISSRPSVQQYRTKYDSSYTTIHIGYCVTILDRNEGFEWLKKHRLVEFLKSRLYAEYKLSKILSAEQAMYIDTIRNDIHRARECDVKKLRLGLGSDCGSSQLTGFDSSQRKSLNSSISDGMPDSDNDSLCNDSVNSELIHLTLDNSPEETVNCNNGNPAEIEEILNYYNNGTSDDPSQEEIEHQEHKKLGKRGRSIQERDRRLENNKIHDCQVTNAESKPLFQNPKEFLVCKACGNRKEANQFLSQGLIGCCKKDEVSAKKELGSVNDKNSDATVQIQDSFKNNLYTPRLDKSNLISGFSSSDVKDLAGRDNLFSYVTHGDVRESDDAADDVTNRDRIGNDTHVTSSDMGNDVINSDVMTHEMKESDVIGDGNIGSVRSSHDREGIDNDGSSRENNGSLGDDDGSSRDDDGSLKDRDGSSRDNDGSPRDNDGSSRYYDGSTRDDHGSPRDYDGSPREDHGSPRDGQGSPRDDHGSTRDYDGSPRYDHGSLKDDHESPRDYDGSPRDYDGSPRDDQGSPRDDHGSLRDYNGSLKDDHESPRDYNGSPRDDHGSPRDDHGSPRDYNGSLKDDHGSPRDDYGSLKDDHETPRDYNGSPRDDHGSPRGNHGSLKDDHESPRDDHGSPRDYNGSLKDDDESARDYDGFDTFEERREVRVGSNSSHEATECCNCHREDNLVPEDGVRSQDMNEPEEHTCMRAGGSLGTDTTLGDKTKNYDSIKHELKSSGDTTIKKILTEDTTIKKILTEDETNVELDVRTNVETESDVLTNRVDKTAKHNVETSISMESKSDAFLSRVEEMPNKGRSLDIRLSDVGRVVFKMNKDAVTDNDSERYFSEASSWQRGSSQNSVSSDGGSVEKELEGRLEDGEDEEEDSQVDLATKQGMDKLKEFLTDTKGETLLLFWLQVELWRHLENEGEKTKIVQEMKDQFLRNGSPLELPSEIKRHITSIVEDLNKAQRIIAQPLHTYWCPRFTLHQLKTRAYATIKHQNLASSGGHASYPTTRTAWADVVPRCNVPGLPHFSTNPHLVRPHSCTPRGIPAETRRFHARSKSAHPRIITTPCHTNAGEKQLELYATPPPPQYGYQKRQVETFPPPIDQDYVSPVRLLINPLPKPRSRTAWSQSNDENKQPSQQHSGNSQENVLRQSLVDALMNHNETGRFFQEYIVEQKNRLWLNCLSFWQALMEYSACFEGHTLNPVLVTKKAQFVPDNIHALNVSDNEGKLIYTRYITTGSSCDIQLDRKRQDEIREKLQPPYEELYDSVEEHVLACLKEPWDRLCRNEHREYDMVPKKETVRYLEVKLKQRKGRSKSYGLVEEFEGLGEGEKDRGRYSIEEANHPLPVSKDGVSFETIIKNRAELEGFQKFLEKKDPKGVMDLMAWTDMETFQRIPKTMEEKRTKKAKEIRNGYLNSKFFFGPNSPATKEAQNLILSMNGSSRIKEQPSASLVSECQKYVRCRIERRWMKLYKESQEYKERQNPTHNVSEVVEDIMLRRRLQRSEAAWRVLNSRWVSSSRDIVALRQTLNNPESCLAFRKFVSLKGDMYENDILFWIEVQKYKDLCHRHASEQCIKKKVQAITSCFITSSIPPELQIDVPIEMAEKLMERITSRNPNIGPYLFREVQTTVFRVLFNMWKDFCSFRSTITDGSIIDVLERKLQQHRVDVRVKREASEKKKIAKQEAEKKKKEKEEKDRKDLKSVEQLVSLMTDTGSWANDEEDIVLWRYSKHLAASEVPAKKMSTRADTNQRSLTTKSTVYITNSLRSERNTGKDHSAVSKSSKFVKDSGSAIANSLYSNQTKRSLQTKESSTLRIPRVKQMGRNVKSNDAIRGNSARKLKMDASQNKTNQGERNTLLKNRRRKETKTISAEELVSRESLETVARIKETGGKDPVVETPRANEPGFKTPGIRDSLSTELAKRYGSSRVGRAGRGEQAGSLRTSVLRRQWNESHGRNTSPVPLTSELLKNFTNSPEGAPLDVRLSLERMNEPQSGHRKHSSVVLPQEITKQQVLTRELSTTDKMSLKHRRGRTANETQDFIPDVIVN